MQKALGQTNNPAGAPAPGPEPGRVAQIAARLETIHGRIAEAAVRAGRGLGAVGLIAVSKTHGATVVSAAYAAGAHVFGENRVQEALPKIDALLELQPAPQWHLIGHLQRNKAKDIVGRFALIHSVDSVRLIEALEEAAAKRGVVQPILLQISLAGEEQKFGASHEALPALLEALAGAPHLRGEGLMTVPPYDDDAEASRPYFRRLRELLAQIGERPNFQPRELSMGMSGDFEVAIEEGATLVRVGTAIFGERE